MALAVFWRAGSMARVVLRLSELTGVEIDAEREVFASLGGTIPWAKVVEAAMSYGPHLR